MNTPIFRGSSKDTYRFDYNGMAKKDHISHFELTKIKRSNIMSGGAFGIWQWLLVPFAIIYYLWPLWLCLAAYFIYKAACKKYG